MKGYSVVALIGIVATFPVTSYISNQPRRLALPQKDPTTTTIDGRKWRTGIYSKVLTTQSRNTLSYSKNSKSRCAGPCPEPAEDWLQDRREALFAGMGALWAAWSGPAAISGIVEMVPDVAMAEYGADAKIEMPNPLQQTIDRASKQCLVESLGSRECLVYESDAADKLYQGVDSALLLGRLEAAAAALATIPGYVQVKQWSKVSGVLTGPLGELIRTMGQLSQSATSEENFAESARFIKRVKNDLYAISDAVSRKDGAQVLKFHTDATNDLVAFLKAL
jgi:hypothetical protein